MFFGLGGLGGFGAAIPLYLILFVVNLVIQLVTGGFGDITGSLGLDQLFAMIFGTQV